MTKASKKLFAVTVTFKDGSMGAWRGHAASEDEAKKAAILHCDPTRKIAIERIDLVEMLPSVSSIVLH